MIQPSHFWVTSQENSECILQRYFHTHFHCSIIHNSQEWKQPKCPSLDEWLKNVIYTPSGILHSLKKERSPVTCYNVEKPQGHYAK